MPITNPQELTRLNTLFCHTLNAANDEQNAFIHGIRDILEDGGPDMSGEELMENIRDVFPAHRLFHPSILSRPEFYGKLRKALEAYDVELLEPDDNRRLNSRRVARTLFQDPVWKDELDIALHLIDSYRKNIPVRIPDAIQNSPPSETQNSASVQNSPQNISETPTVQPLPTIENSIRNEKPISPSIAQAIFNRYKDEKSRYGGNLTESWPETVDEYDSVADGLNMSEELKLKLLPAILKGDARRFYKNEVFRKSENYGDAIQAISNHFNGGAHQHRIKNYLLGLKIDKFINADTDLSDAFVKLTREVERYFP